MLHFYTETIQPATGWTDMNTDKPIKMGYEPEELIYTCCCGKHRPAKDCVVQSYFDGLRVWCAAGKGCKDPQLIAAKKAREFANRSAAQKKRWAKAANAKVQAPCAAPCARSLGTTG